MAITKTTTKPAPKFVTVRAVARLNTDGEWDIVGYGNQESHPLVEEFAEVLDDNFRVTTQYKDFVIEIKLPAYAGRPQTSDYKFEVKA